MLAAEDPLWFKTLVQIAVPLAVVIAGAYLTVRFTQHRWRTDREDLDRRWAADRDDLERRWAEDRKAAHDAWIRDEMKALYGRAASVAVAGTGIAAMTEAVKVRTAPEVLEMLFDDSPEPLIMFMKGNPPAESLPSKTFLRWLDVWESLGDEPNRVAELMPLFTPFDTARAFDTIVTLANAAAGPIRIVHTSSATVRQRAHALREIVRVDLDGRSNLASLYSTFVELVRRDLGLDGGTDASSRLPKEHPAAS